jgi:hypothetical protein
MKEWFNNDIFLINGILSTDSTIHTISNVAIIPSVFVVSGRGPCIIEENEFELKNFVGLQIEDMTFYVQCAGPNAITITKSTFKTSRTKNQIKKRSNQRDFETFNQIRLKNNYYNFKTTKLNCINNCISDSKCIAATYYNGPNVCFYYDESFEWEMADRNDRFESIINTDYIQSKLPDKKLGKKIDLTI